MAVSGLRFAHDHAPKGPFMKEALVITFSPIEFDSRVRRQIKALSESFNVTVFLPEHSKDLASAQVFVLGWKETWRNTTGKDPGRFTRLFASAVYRTRQVLRVVGAHSVADRLPFGFQWSANRLLSNQKKSFDLVVANDVETLPLAFRNANGAPVVADLHEYAYGQTQGASLKHKFEAQYLRFICRKYLSRCSEVSVVGQGIADLYFEDFGVKCSVLPSMPDYRDIEPTKVLADNISLVHHGIYTPHRGIEQLITALAQLPEYFSLHLVLVRAPVDELRNLAKSLSLASERIWFYDFVPPDDLASFLNQFDVEVIFVPPTIINHRLGLPNKFFEAIQARLAVVSGPTIEIEKRITDFGIGATTASFEVSELVGTLSDLTPEKIFGWKLASHEAAKMLNWEAIKPDYLSFVE